MPDKTGLPSPLAHELLGKAPVVGDAISLCEKLARDEPGSDPSLQSVDDHQAHLIGVLERIGQRTHIHSPRLIHVVSVHHGAEVTNHRLMAPDGTTA
jgi:hypothetical protein